MCGFRVCVESLVAAGSRLENMSFNHLRLYIKLQKGGGVKRQVSRKAGGAKRQDFKKRKCQFDSHNVDLFVSH